MWFRRRADSDFRAEIEEHIRLESDRLIAEGMPPEEARYAARRAFGNVAAVQERFYESQRWRGWDQLRQDVRYGFRSLRNAPGFAAAAALTIALGVGANTAVFSLVEAVLLRSLPVRNPQELVFVTARGTADSFATPPYPYFARLRAEAASFTGLAAFAIDELRVGIDGRPEQVMGQIASGSYFELLGMEPSLGRLMNAEDETLNPPVAIISHRYWQRRFGGDPKVLGKIISFGNQSFTIIGVTPPAFYGLEPGRPIDVTVPITIARNNLADSGTWWLHGIVGRLKPGISRDRARAQSDAVFQSFNAGLPAGLTSTRFRRMELRPAAQGMDGLRRPFSKPLYVLMVLVGLVLLMAVANVANLLLARGMARQREFAIRLATGAGRARLFRQLLTETVLLFAFGAVPGVLVANWGVDAIEAMFAQGRRAITLEAGLNWQVLGFASLATLVAALLAGLFPTCRALRIDPEQALREGQARTGESRRSAAFARGLVALQVALSFVLLVGAVSFVRSLMNLRDMDPGFRNEHVLTMSVELPDAYVQSGKSPQIWNRVLETVREIAGVRAAGLSAFTPLSGRDRAMPVRARGFQPPTFEDSRIRINPVSEGYFETLGIPLLHGRLLNERDTETAPKVALINETAARKLFAGRDPIGEPLEFPPSGNQASVYRIVGVVGDTKHRNLREPVPPFAFISIRQPRNPERRVTLSVASAVPDALMTLLRPIRTGLAGVEPQLFISEVITMRSQVDSTLLAERLLSGLSSAFGSLALILAAVGLYSVLSYRIGRQRHSIGVRIALGASPHSVAFSVVRQSAFVVIAGLLAGLPFAMLSARLAESMLWGVKATDPGTYILGAAVLLLAGFASAYLPARRASAIAPAEALRSD